MNKFTIALITLVSVLVMSFSPVAYAGGAVNTIVNIVVSPIVNFVINEVSVIIDAAVIGVVSIVTLGFCSPVGPCGGILDPFISDLGCRSVIGSSPDFIGSACKPGGPDAIGNIGMSTTSISTFSSAGGSTTCTSITLSGINAQGHNYAVVRNGSIVAQLSASQSSFTDTNLTPHSNYSYAIRIPYPAESGWTTSDSAPILAYTQCLPQCSFGVVSSSVAKFGTTDLRWACRYNAVNPDGGRCAISDSSGSLQKNVDSASGSLSVSLADNNQYILKCSNKDGSISIPQDVSVFTPDVKEIKP